MTQESMPEPSRSPLRPTDDEARLLARTLIQSARTAALATLDPDGDPLVTLVGCASLEDGSPLLLVSQLSQHTRHLLARPRVSLLLTDTSAKAGKGDPLAHPRLSLSGEAVVIETGSDGHAHARSLYLASHPKAALYIDFSDFLLVRIRPRSAALNGGFGKAYQLVAEDLAYSPQK